MPAGLSAASIVGNHHDQGAKLVFENGLEQLCCKLFKAHEGPNAALIMNSFGVPLKNAAKAAKEKLEKKVAAVTGSSAEGLQGQLNRNDSERRKRLAEKAMLSRPAKARRVSTGLIKLL